ncbi:MAG TPA: hypothetical protein P5056_00680 [Candidatus Paceibacterota bacterium]|nr:hypothetical protein [Candidatus Paceibacterota bacterium]
MLNKYFRGQFIFAFLLSSLPIVTLAADKQTLGDILSCGGEPCRLSNILSIIQALNRYIAFTLLPIVATLAFLYAGFIMVVGTGNPKEVSKGKEIISNTIYGIIIVFAAYYIINLIVSGLAGGTADTRATEFLQ